MLGTVALAFSIQSARAEGGTIYIRADGSIDPPTAPISTIDNVTYTLTSNINDSIVIERDNIVCDGAGQTVQGTNVGPSGIDWKDQRNNQEHEHFSLLSLHLPLFFIKQHYKRK